jgi:formamidopyrimidine-DNA glycosylase
MPELPEVETIVRSLQNPKEWLPSERQSMRERPGVIGRQINSAALYWERTLAMPTPAEFLQQMKGQVIQKASRRGKFIVLTLDDGALLFHLRMSGDLRVEEQSAPVQTHDRLLLNFSDGLRLVFNDTRKFGRAWLVKDAQTVLSGLGPEPLEPTTSGLNLYQRWHGSSRAIKTLLLDQSILAGVGNIYSDEALFLAGIHPLTAGKELSIEDCECLLSAVRTVLKKGIENNGASIDWVYRGGGFQNHFKVYQRTGEACEVCGSPIQRLVIGQRSSHFCPVCQPNNNIDPI